MDSVEHTKPFHYINPPFAFFDEGAEIRGEHVNLMGFSCGDESAYGEIERIMKFVRGLLEGTSPDAIRAILQLADLGLSALMRNGGVQVVVNGDCVRLEDLDLRRVNQIDFMGVIIELFSMCKFVLVADDTDGAERVEVTPAKFCAAYALRMLYNGTRAYLRESELREYYLMQAATAYGLLQPLVSREASPIAKAIQKSLRKAFASSGGLATLAKAPSRGAKAKAQELWPEANRKGWTAARFHAAITGAGYSIPYDTARKWLTKLRKTGER